MKIYIPLFILFSAASAYSFDFNTGIISPPDANPDSPYWELWIREDLGRFLQRQWKPDDGSFTGWQTNFPSGDTYEVRRADGSVTTRQLRADFPTQGVEIISISYSKDSSTTTYTTSIPYSYDGNTFTLSPEPETTYDVTEHTLHITNDSGTSKSYLIEVLDNQTGDVIDSFVQWIGAGEFFDYSVATDEDWSVSATARTPDAELGYRLTGDPIVADTEQTTITQPASDPPPAGVDEPETVDSQGKADVTLTDVDDIPPDAPSIDPTTIQTEIERTIITDQRDTQRNDELLRGLDAIAQRLQGDRIPSMSGIYATAQSEVDPVLSSIQSTDIVTPLTSPIPSLPTAPDTSGGSLLYDYSLPVPGLSTTMDFTLDFTGYQGLMAFVKGLIYVSATIYLVLRMHDDVQSTL